MLTTAHLSDIEKQLKILESYRAKNFMKELYFQGKIPLKSLDISLPEDKQNLKLSCPFPHIVVTAIEERINLQGFYADPALEVDKIFKENDLESKAPMIHTDVLLFGTGYVVTGRGNTDLGEPEILISPESPNNCVGIPNLRTGRLDSAIVVRNSGRGKEAIGTLYWPNETVPFKIDEGGFITADGDIDFHNFGRLTVRRFVNRAQTSNDRGESEIDETIMRITDQAIRTKATLELNREHYGSPRPVFSNVSAAEFTNEDGTPRNPFDSRLNKGIILGAGAGADNDTSANNPSATGVPTVTQLTVGSPEPLLNMLRRDAEDVAMHSGVPISAFGISTANPPSADSIRAQETPLVKKAERRITSFRRVWEEVMRDAVEIRDGIAPELGSIQAKFADPYTPTRAAEADALTKYVAIKALDPMSNIVLDRMGLSEQEKDEIRRERKLATTAALMQNLATAAGAAPVQGLAEEA